MMMVSRIQWWDGQKKRREGKAKEARLDVAVIKKARKTHWSPKLVAYKWFVIEINVDECSLVA